MWKRLCTSSLTVPPAEYDAVRAHAQRFLIASDHENPEVERVVYQNGHFAVVETFVGESSRIARFDVIGMGRLVLPASKGVERARGGCVP